MGSIIFRLLGLFVNVHRGWTVITIHGAGLFVNVHRDWTVVTIHGAGHLNIYRENFSFFINEVGYRCLRSRDILSIGTWVQ